MTSYSFPGFSAEQVTSLTKLFQGILDSSLERRFGPPPQQLDQPAVPPKEAADTSPPNSVSHHQPVPLPAPAAVESPQGTTTKKPFTIAICGGGIAGLALAIGLLHRNGPFQLYESHSGFAEVGAGVSFGPNALSAMGLIDPKIKEGYDKRSTRNAYKDEKGYFLEYYSGMDSGLGKVGETVAVVGREDIEVSSIHRMHFMDVLAPLVPNENVTFGKKVLEVEELEDGVRLHFADGGTAEASAAVGCDGIKSNLRQNVLGKEDRAAYPVFTGKYGYRGLIPMDKAVGLLGELAKRGTMWLGHHGHLLTAPIQKGQIMAVGAFKQKKDGKWEDERWVKPMDRGEMEGDFEDWGETVKKITNLIETLDVWALFDHLPAKTYYKGRMCLSGDAAHASAPHQ